MCDGLRGPIQTLFKSLITHALKQRELNHEAQK